MQENFEKYIEGLSPELQEKARECKTKEELNAFIADNDLELPEDALEMVSGGCGTSTPPPKKPYCKKCGCEVAEIYGESKAGRDYGYKCFNCEKPGIQYKRSDEVEWR